MFHDGSYMIGMHGFWWLFWLLMIGVFLFYSWGQPGRRAERLRETPQEVLHRRLASGEITPKEYEERKALIDRDAASKS